MIILPIMIKLKYFTISHNFDIEFDAKIELNGSEYGHKSISNDRLITCSKGDNLICVWKGNEKDTDSMSLIKTFKGCCFDYSENTNYIVIGDKNKLKLS